MAALGMVAAGCTAFGCAGACEEAEEKLEECNVQVTPAPDGAFETGQGCYNGDDVDVCTAECRIDATCSELRQLIEEGKGPVQDCYCECYEEAGFNDPTCSKPA